MSHPSLLVYPPHGKQIQDWLEKVHSNANACFTFNFGNSRVTQSHMVSFGNYLIPKGEQLLFGDGYLPREPLLVTVAEQSVDRGIWHGHGAAHIRSTKRLTRFLRDFHAVMFDEARRFMRDGIGIKNALPKVTCTPMSAEESKLWWGYINKDGFTDADGDRFSFGHPRQR
jgi:hypothetical protein